MNRISIASPQDFKLGKPSYVGQITPGAFPYCLDIPRARAIYIENMESDAVQAAPFSYLYLRRNARSVISVPIEHKHFSNKKSAMAPIFLFSPGRCGSTFLSQCLYEAEIPNISEPDIYTQLLSMPVRSLLGRPFQRAIWGMTKDLFTSLGRRPTMVVKLRAKNCYAPQLLLRNTHQRTLFMTRSFEPWARSTLQVFGYTPGETIRKYMTALKCYAYLLAQSHCHLVRYEELMSQPEKTSIALGQFLQSPLDSAAVERARMRDSQAGTPLGLEERRKCIGWETKFDSAMELWRSPSVVNERARLGVRNIWD